MPKLVAPLTTARINPAKPGLAVIKLYDGGRLAVWVIPTARKRGAYSTADRQTASKIPSQSEITRTSCLHRQERHEALRTDLTAQIAPSRPITMSPANAFSTASATPSTLVASFTAYTTPASSNAWRAPALAAASSSARKFSPRQHDFITHPLLPKVSAILATPHDRHVPHMRIGNISKRLPIAGMPSLRLRASRAKPWTSCCICIYLSSLQLSQVTRHNN